MKKLLIAALISCFFESGYSQKIVSNILLNDIDVYRPSDTLFQKLKIQSIQLFGCNGNQKNEDSCILYCQKKFNDKGMLVEMIKGDNLMKDKIDYYIKYDQISDTTFETITKYPKNSTAVDESLFTDSLINGQQQKLCVYKKDRSLNIYMRSVYRIDKAGQILDIKRLDLDNNLKQIFYPLGNRKPKKQWTDSSIDEYHKTLSYNAIFEENYYKGVYIYDLSGRILESTYYNSTYGDTYKGDTKQVYIYDAQNNLVRKEIVDLDNQFVSEERFYYKGKALLRYVKYESPRIDEIDVERLYDSAGRNIESRGRIGIPERPITWKYYYDDNGLSTKDEYYEEGHIQSVRLYIYNPSNLVKANF